MLYTTCALRPAEGYAARYMHYMLQQCQVYRLQQCHVATRNAPSISCVAHNYSLLADREGQVLDYVQFNRRAALNSSLKHSSCSYLPPQDAVQADEAVHMYPFDFAPQCEVRAFQAVVWCAGQAAGTALAPAGTLQNTMHCRP